MFDIFDYTFLRIALVGAILASASTAILSVFISLKKVSYMGEALSHVSFAGIAIALFFGLNFNITTLLFVVAIALLIGYISKKHDIDETNITTIFLSVSMALAIIIINLKKDYTFDLSSYLFGNILLITKIDLMWLCILLILNLVFLVGFFKEIFYMAYNQEISEVFKIKTNIIYYVFLIFLAINIVITVKSIGVVLITAQLILPGIAALNITKRIKSSIILSVIISEMCGLAGFILSYYLDVPSGATIVMTLFFAFLISLLIKRNRRTN